MISRNDTTIFLGRILMFSVIKNDRYGRHCGNLEIFRPRGHSSKGQNCLGMCPIISKKSDNNNSESSLMRLHLSPK